MKPTPTERAALAKARSLAPLTLEEATAISARPDLLEFPHRHDRLRLAQSRLVWAAEEWNRRELRLALYRDAVEKRDGPEISYRRVTSPSSTPRSGRSARIWSTASAACRKPKTPPSACSAACICRHCTHPQIPV